MLNIKFLIKQFGKMAVQHIYLPFVYSIFRHKKIKKGLVIFADAHHTTLPFSMQKMHHEVSKIKGITICDMFYDFQKRGFKSLILWMTRFMKLYAKAEFVFICDNFLPVSSCKKRKETKVIQLWHSGGLMKKAGYDAEDSVPSIYKGNVFDNYDLWTVSAPCCVDIISSSMHQPAGVVQATGISRSDIYFDDKYNKKCRDNFFKEYPQAIGKKIILWVPTFRGNASEPKLEGEKAVDNAFKELNDCFLIKKLHPHFENKNADKVTCKIPSEQLFTVADLLITDYSSIVFDYLAYKKPFVLFAPDFDEYKKNHGFYVDYYSFPTIVAKTESELVNAIKKELENRDKAELETCYQYHMAFCDGHATERILKRINLK